MSWWVAPVALIIAAAAYGLSFDVRRWWENRCWLEDQHRLTQPGSVAWCEEIWALEYKRKPPASVRLTEGREPSEGEDSDDQPE